MIGSCSLSLTSTKPIIVCGHVVYSLSVLRSRCRGCVGGCNTISKSSWRSNSHCIRSSACCGFSCTRWLLSSIMDTSSPVKSNCAMSSSLTSYYLEIQSIDSAQEILESTPYRCFVRQLMSLIGCEFLVVVVDSSFMRCGNMHSALVSPPLLL